MMNNISELTQKLHDLIFCREPNPMWENGKSRASMYFIKNPTNKEIIQTADSVAKEIANLLSGLPPNDPSISQCEYALTHCGYDLGGTRINKRGTTPEGKR